MCMFARKCVSRTRQSVYEWVLQAGHCPAQGKRLPVFETGQWTNGERNQTVSTNMPARQMANTIMKQAGIDHRF